jgi:hypothetical protein
MSRQEEIKESIEYLNHSISISTKESMNKEQLININLAVIAHQLEDISVTLAIIADKTTKY